MYAHDMKIKRNHGEEILKPSNPAVDDVTARA